MLSYELSPFARHFGPGRLMATLDDARDTGPAYDIIKAGDNSYVITLVAAGFKDSDITVEAEAGVLTINAQPSAVDEGVTYLHRGRRNAGFKRAFRLAEHVEVKSARLEDGLLHVALEREVPEALAPRRIAIGTGDPVREAA
ncbi:MAG: Hsp20 family protein [Pseudomonadota bacterium]